MNTIVPTGPPPLFVTSPVSGSPRAPKLRRINQEALAYVQRMGLSVDGVYPNGMAKIRALAPPAGSIDAATFASAVGLSLTEIYPPNVANTRRSIHWMGTAAGLIAGVLVGWPWPLVGVVGGVAIDWWCGRAAGGAA
jgi:hypothetical protein